MVGTIQRRTLVRTYEDHNSKANLRAVELVGEDGMYTMIDIAVGTKNSIPPVWRDAVKIKIYDHIIDEMAQHMPSDMTIFAAREYVKSLQDKHYDCDITKGAILCKR